MNVIKRDETIVAFDKNKIIIAITKAMQSNGKVITEIANKIANEIESELQGNEIISISDIELFVYRKLVENGEELTAKAYEDYRAVREYQRKHNTIDNKVLGIINGTDKSTLNENSNKSKTLISTSRDLVAEEVSKDISLRMMLPPHIAQAHQEGIIHIHDLGHYLNKSFNCCLVNLDDMLQNGTVINGKLVEKPHSFRTACTIATQIIAQVASGQFGGQTVSLSHLAPFVRISAEKIREEVENEWCEIRDYDSYSGFQSIVDEQIENIVKSRLQKEISDGVQTFQYQINTLQTSNGQSPFLSVFMYISEMPEYEKETAMIIEEMIKQRIQGMKNEKGVWITPAFPKLLYVLDENNITENSEYWYLTELAAKCVSKRMMPDFISAKHMRQNYEGNVFGCMGCVEGEEIITYQYNGLLYVESFKRMWNRISDNYPILKQPNGKDEYIDVVGASILIYDTKNGWTNVKKIIRNTSNKWVNLKISHGRNLICTVDHPLPTKNRGRVQAGDLTTDDILTINSVQISKNHINFDNAKAWLLGFMLCDGCYDSHVFTSIALDTENDIQDMYIKAMKKCFNNNVKVVERHRDKRGDYKDLVSTGNVTDIIDYLSCKFEGLTKNRRHIPNEVFSWNTEAKMAFLAGMIDADGYINPATHGGSIVQIGSTNKELALQQMALAQCLGMPSAVYQNHYGKTNKIRYRVEFTPTSELLEYIISQKKKDNFVGGKLQIENNEGKINAIEHIDITQYSYDVETGSDHFEVSGIYSHNCRAWLSPYKGGINNEEGHYKWYGRFNMGLTSINLADCGLSAKRNIKDFWDIFEERLELCFESLMLRYHKLEDVTSDASPIHWQYGAIARLPKHAPIKPLLQNGYATISLGYIGVYECVKSLIGKSHTTPEGEKLALEIVQHMKDKVLEWKKRTGLGFALYGTPSESLTEKFANATVRRWGTVDGEEKRGFLTNSYHVFVEEPINAFDKLKFESQFHPISSGGCISYIEAVNLVNNIPAVLSVIKFIYDNIQYAEINTKSDYCHECGYTGEIMIDENLDWYCPNCGNRDTSKMNVVRRTCGYLGENFWNKGRTEEIKNRYVHLGAGD